MTLKNKITVRQMEYKDITAVAEIEKLCFSSPWNEQMISEEIDNDFSQMFVAESEGAVCGYCGVQLLAGEGYITNIAVHPDFRRKGIGRLLLQRLEALANEEHAEFLTLEVRESNAPAIALYSGMGFEAVGIRRQYYTNPTEDALLMTREFEK